MKTIQVNVCILLFVVNIISAQNYESFFGENETHIVRLSNNSTLGEYPFSMDSLAITNEVTTQDNQSLKEVEYYRTNQTHHEDHQLLFYLREDLVEGKLWFRADIDANEYLIADLSLSEGDTTTEIIGVVNQVNEVNQIDGKKLIKFNQLINVAPSTGLDQQFMFFKEGVFPIFLNLQGDYPLSSFESVTTCVIKDGVEIFSIDDVWDINVEDIYFEWLSCEQTDLYENLSNENFEKVEFSIYPNPVSDQLHMESERSQIQQVEIFNLNGKRVLDVSYQEDQPIDVSNLAKGMYLVKIQTEKGSLTKKLVKE